MERGPPPIPPPKPSKAPAAAGARSAAVEARAKSPPPPPVRRKENSAAALPPPPPARNPSRECISGAVRPATAAVPQPPPRRAKEDEGNAEASGGLHFAVMEILTAERAYVRDLQALNKNFVTALAAETWEGVKEVKLALDQLNLASILMVNEQLLEELEKHYGNAARGHASISSIGNIFLQLSPYFKAYTFFISSYEAVLGRLDKLTANNGEFRQFCEQTKAKPEMRNLDLASFLIMPVQRLCRYPLLLEAVKKQLPKSATAEHAKLDQVIAGMSSIARVVNERKRETESRERVLEIQRAVKNVENFRLVTPNRFFLREAMVRVEVDEEPAKGWCLFLFNDSILLARPRRNMRSHAASLQSFIGRSLGAQEAAPGGLPTSPAAATSAHYDEFSFKGFIVLDEFIRLVEMEDPVAFGLEDSNCRPAKVYRFSLATVADRDQIVKAIKEETVLFGDEKGMLSPPTARSMRHFNSSASVASQSSGSRVAPLTTSDDSSPVILRKKASGNLVDPTVIAQRRRSKSDSPAPLAISAELNSKLAQVAAAAVASHSRASHAPAPPPRRKAAPEEAEKGEAGAARARKEEVSLSALEEAAPSAVEEVVPSDLDGAIPPPLPARDKPFAADLREAVSSEGASATQLAEAAEVMEMLLDDTLSRVAASREMADKLELDIQAMQEEKFALHNRLQELRVKYNLEPRMIRGDFE